MSKRKAPQNQRKQRKKPVSAGHRGSRGRSDQSHAGAGAEAWLYGVHAVEAALLNPARTCRRLVMTEHAADAAEAILARCPHASLAAEITDREHIDRLLPDGAVHQGMALQVTALPERHVEDIVRQTRDMTAATLAIVDQGTDPRNIGAILRSAAAFGVCAVIVQDRHAPDATGVLAKSASGALETVPMVRATNLARTLEQLKNAGFWSVGLDGAGETGIDALDWPKKSIVVLGAEGKGLRRLVRESCDFLVRIPMTPAMESLNLSNAAAIAFYEAFRAHCRER